MKITEVRIFPTESKDGKLKAFATMTFDDWFVVRNVKVIQGNNGLFVAMPSRKAMDPCPKCKFKNVRGSRFCNQCGAQLPAVESMAEENGEKSGGHMDIAHPITQDCRVYIQEQIIGAYRRESGKQVSEGVSYGPAEAEKVDVAAEDRAASSSGMPEQRGIEEANDIEL